MNPALPAHAGQSVLITGAGGYIGSALAQAVAATGPSRLVLLDSSEHNLFQILQQVETAEPVLGNVCDANLLDDIFTRYQPDAIYHAAAFKHVPLLERHPIAAIHNNTIGTYTLAQGALRHGTSKLILISTDKAVNPSSILGVSKRLAELVVVGMNMNVIRLVNVIGSPGSVVPIFLKQIADRRPVTVTHPEATRWFMALNEAVDAILSAGASEMDGRIFVPELGEPTRIADLAAFLIGEAEVPIVFTGCRPGDKLTEELVSKTEAIGTCRMQPAELDEIMQRLSACIASRDVPALIRTLRSAVPEYIPSDLLR